MNLDKTSQYGRVYYQKNKEKRKKASAEYKKRNPEYYKNYMAQYYIEHKAECVERAKQWGKNNPEKVAASRRKNKKNHPEVNKAYKSRRKMRCYENMSREDRDISIEYRKAIAHDPCFYCGAIGEQDDHFNPLAKGGTDHWWNLVRACKPCNLRKFTKHGDEFVKELNETNRAAL